MVRKLLTLDLCDDHAIKELPDTQAVVEHQLTINGGPLRRILLCARCALIWEPFIELYRMMGQDITPAPTPVAPKKARAKTKAIEPAEPPAQESPALLGEEQEKPKKLKQYVVCPLARDHKTGAPSKVLYGSRNMHADQNHNMRAWEIKWEDPDGFLKVPCTEHPLCKENGMAFPSKAALSQHIVFLRDRQVKEVSNASTSPERADEQDSDTAANDS